MQWDSLGLLSSGKDINIISESFKKKISGIQAAQLTAISWAMKAEI